MQVLEQVEQLHLLHLALQEVAVRMAPAVMKDLLTAHNLVRVGYLEIQMEIQMELLPQHLIPAIQLEVLLYQVIAVGMELELQVDMAVVERLLVEPVVVVVDTAAVVVKVEVPTGVVVVVVVPTASLLRKAIRFYQLVVMVQFPLHT
jgi:hypothetical protein